MLVAAVAVTRCCGRAGGEFNNFPVTNVFVFSSGRVYWGLSTTVKTYCTLNMKLFPFDTQSCKIVFVSWSFYGSQLNLHYNNSLKNHVNRDSENQVDLALVDQGVGWPLPPPSPCKKNAVWLVCSNFYNSYTHTLSRKKTWCRTFAITSSTVNRF